MVRRFTAQDLWAIRRVGQPEPAPDGDFLVVPVTDHDVEANVPRTALYRVAVDGSEPPRMLAAADASAPAISPDGRRLAFNRSATPEAPAQLYVMPLDGGEPHRLTDMPLGAGAARWLPDGSGLVFAAPLLRDAPSLAGTEAGHEEFGERVVKAVVTEDRIYRYWDHWLAGSRVHHLFRIDVDGGEPMDLTPGVTGFLTLDDPAGSWDIAPDGSEVAYTANATPPPFDRLQSAIYTVSLDGSGSHQLTDELPAFQRRPRYHPDGRWLVFGIQREHDFYGDRVRLVRHDRTTGASAVLTEGWDRSASAWEFDADRIVLAAEDGGHLNLYRMPIDVAEPELLVRGGAAHGPMTAGGQCFFRLESQSYPAVVARVPVGGGTVERVADFNRDVLGGIDFGAVEEIELTGAGGDMIQASVVYPPDFDPSRKWPLLHNIHGGPHATAGDDFHYRWNTQVFAGAGYVVLSVNFHGSSSWGEDFARSIHGGWGDKPTTDVLAATDHMVESGSIDPDRMAIAGGSYGGYLVAWLVSQTDRFAAAICHAGIANLVGQYASDITQGRSRSMGAAVWDDVAAVQRWSPSNHADGMTTPTLVIHGEEDYRVVVTQGLELYGILKAKGVEARLVYYPDEGHWILKPQNSLHWYGEFLGWLDRWLR